MNPKPFFIADNLALDFANTEMAPHDAVVEFMPNGDALLDWLLEAALIDTEEHAALLQRFDGETLNRMAAQARTLRHLLRTALPAIKEGTPLKDAIGPLLKEVNAVLAQDPRYLSADLIEGTVHVRQRRSWDKPEQLLALVAEQIALLFMRSDYTLVRKCANPACWAWFEDKTKAHRRQYCSPSACGNRAKVAAFRQRKKAEAAGDSSAGVE
jgi:predicted RNA-binding Zn ribbon-like protein